jgi:hypothetical protein
MKTRKFLIPAILSLFGATWVVASIQAEEHLPKPLNFKELDRDRNGYISSKEAGISPDLLEVFSELDRNMDSNLSKEEFALLEKGKGETSPEG